MRHIYDPDFGDPLVDMVGDLLHGALMVLNMDSRSPGFVEVLTNRRDTMLLGYVDSRRPSCSSGTAKEEIVAVALRISFAYSSTVFP